MLFSFVIHQPPPPAPLYHEPVAVGWFWWIDIVSWIIYLYFVVFRPLVPWKWTFRESRCDLITFNRRHCCSRVPPPEIVSLSPKDIVFDNQWNVSNVPAGSVGGETKTTRNGAAVWPDCWMSRCLFLTCAYVCEWVKKNTHRHIKK
jgi:hypothetical protein